MKRDAGRDAVAAKGWMRAHRWLLLRRLSQLSILALFAIGPLWGIWWFKGNLSSSVLFDHLPMTDPLLFMQVLASGHLPEVTLLVGTLVVIAFYALVGGRVFCAWVCPLNPVTDAALWLRRRLGIRKSRRIDRSTRFWLLGLAAALPLLTGTVVWELINPVSILHRGLLFGLGLGWMVIVAVFLFDLFYTRGGFCGHLCPQGALYSLIGRFSPVRVSASRRRDCNDCMDCYAVCPEPQVIKPALKGERQGRGPIIADSACTHCGRCIDVCAKNVFQFAVRHQQPTAAVRVPSVNQ